MYDIRKQFRISKEMEERFKHICNHLKIGNEADAFREALKLWINDQEWKIKIRGVFVEEER